MWREFNHDVYEVSACDDGKAECYIGTPEGSDDQEEAGDSNF